MGDWYCTTIPDLYGVGASSTFSRDGGSAAGRPTNVGVSGHYQLAALRILQRWVTLTSRANTWGSPGPPLINDRGERAGARPVRLTKGLAMQRPVPHGRDQQARCLAEIVDQRVALTSSVAKNFRTQPWRL